MNWSLFLLFCIFFATIALLKNYASLNDIKSHRRGPFNIIDAICIALVLYWLFIEKYMNKIADDYLVIFSIIAPVAIFFYVLSVLFPGSLKSKTREERWARSGRIWKEYGIFFVIMSVGLFVMKAPSIKKDPIAFLFILTACVFTLFLYFDTREGFGMSPGTPVQLSSTHVPTREDMYYWKNVYPKVVRKEIYNLTESDLH